MPPLSKTLKAGSAKKKMRRNGVTPRRPFTKEVQLVLNRLPSQQPPLWLPFTDVGEDYKGAACHLNAKHRAATAGGERVHGWVVWQYPKAAQAEFHSVWRGGDGALMDITPHRNEQAEILFVEDPSLKIVRDPEGGAIVYSDITSDPGPSFYRVGTKATASPTYRVNIQPGGPLDDELFRLGQVDFF